MQETRYDRLIGLLRARFPAATIELFDDSEAHIGHAHGGARAGAARDGIEATADTHGGAGETHYRLRIAAAEFHSLTLIQIHRAILAAVKPETDAGMHSFVIESAAAPKSG